MSSKIQGQTLVTALHSPVRLIKCDSIVRPSSSIVGPVLCPPSFESGRTSQMSPLLRHSAMLCRAQMFDPSLRTKPFQCFYWHNSLSETLTLPISTDQCAQLRFLSSHDSLAWHWKERRGKLKLWRVKPFTHRAARGIYGRRRPEYKVKN